MKSKSLVWILMIIGISVFVIGFLGGCNAVENESTSGTRLTIELITGLDLEGEPGSTTVFSDVIKTSGTIVNDPATATLRAALLDPEPESTSYYQSVIVDQIDISYSRTDGLSVEGRDVPYSFSQEVNKMIGIGETGDLNFVVVQHNAKSESPLVELVNYGQEHVLKMEAHITFYSRDVGGHRLAPVTGSISIWFANFADDE
jgi:hypothetical protein